eukprot:TRINITY_DN7795_c0_g1_i4.p2 TRINITY_DN7795_c0_g1~~TRINITY_DN7795_c0_g1_i4.p2  ORF type:complete len:172 (+),score=13.60 TRINITY_DN7795_c0_g1_i4:132-647(+)
MQGKAIKLYSTTITRQPSFSRSFGDFEFKTQEGNEELYNQPMIPIPQIEMVKMSIDNNYIVLATQPFWEYWDEDTLTQSISKRFKDGYDCSTIVKSCIFECCRRFKYPEYRDLSPVIGVCDDVTMMLIQFDSEKQKEIQYNWVGKKEFNPEVAEMILQSSENKKAGNCTIM